MKATTRERGPSVEATMAAADAWQSETPSLRHRAAALWLDLLYRAASRAPWPVRRLMPLFVHAAWLLSPRLRARTLDNAKWLLGDDATRAERRRLAKRVISNCYLFVLDVGLAPTKTLDELRQSISSIDGRHHYDRARRAGRGLVVATAHLGSFEVGVAALRHLERNSAIHVVFQRDRSSHFDRARQALHEHLDVVEAPVDEGWDTWLRLRDALRKDDLVLMQADRVMPGQKGVRVPFCGGHILLPTGPAKLAALTGSPILPVFAIRQPDGTVHLRIARPIDVGSDRSDMNAALVELAAVIEQQVRACPEQWLMLHRVWCEDIERDRRHGPESDGAGVVTAGGRPDSRLEDTMAPPGPMTP